MSISVRNQSGTLERVAGFADTDAVLSATSKNPIQNKSVYAALEQKIEKTVDDLVNYYTTAQVYNKTEIRDLIGAINTLTISVVSTLPVSDISSTTIYFVGPTSGTYDEYVYVNNAWVKIGDTQIDLSDYVTSTDLTTALQDYYTKTAADAIFDNYYTKTEVNTLIDDARADVDSAISNTSTNPVQNKVIKAALDDKQDNIFIGTKAEWEALTAAQKAKYMLVTLTDDGDYVGNITNNIISGEMSAVTSNAVYNGLAGKQNTLTFDTAPTSGSRNPATSGGIYTALSGKQDSLRGNTYVGNIDTLYGQNKIYWINIANLPSGNTGALPFDTGFFHLICLSETDSSSSQIAIPYYGTTGDTVGSGQLYYRQYTNSRWYSWRRVYDSTETTSAITSAIAALDVDSVGGSGKYISAIKQDNGKISATAGTLSTTPTNGSTTPITSGGVYTGINSAIQALDVNSVGGSGKYISAIKQDNGKISATATSLSTSPTKDSVYPITSGAVYSKFANIQSNFTVEIVSKDDISIAKDNMATISLKATKAGYQPLGIVGYDINQATHSGYGLSQCTVIAVRMSGSNAYAQIYNRMTDHAAKIKITFYVLYAAKSSS